jgi:putative ABC transport system permease protein
LGKRTIIGVSRPFATLPVVLRTLADYELAFPWGQLALGLVAAALAGLIASLGPARKAARMDVLRAIAYK